MSHPSLHSTERHLVTLFVGWAFIFLLMFEGFFLGSRYIFEEQISVNDFKEQIERIESRAKDGREWGERRPGGPKIGINLVQINGSGEIMSEEFWMRWERVEINTLSDPDFLINLATGSITRDDGMIFYKRSHPSDPLIFQVFIRKSGYPIDDIIRDIFRFMMMNIFILLPFWFLGRHFVREILKPIGMNMDVMSQFIHDAGHELKTPLAIISGNLQILRDMKGKDPELIDTSISTIYSMSDSIDGLVELSNLKLPKKRENINLLSHIEEIIKIYQSDLDKKNITTSLKIPTALNIQMESKHFSILFSNLLKNAITYNKEWGTIEVQYKGKLLSVQDSGIGMKQEDMEKIFERFFRVDRSGIYTGSGIGLALVDRIIKLYGWTISVESKIWEGTLFSIKIK